MQLCQEGQQSSDELVEIEEEELLPDVSLRRECGEVCASDVTPLSVMQRMMY